MIGLPTVFANTSYRGQGYSVAVIDTGIDYDDPDLGGGFGAGYKVVAGYNFVNDTANPMDDNGHGTVVASEIAANSSTYSGVAPDADLIALKVLDASGSGTFANVLNALNWVIANRTKYNIVAINLSLGSGNYTANPYTFLDPDLSTLTADNVFIGVASGNSYYDNKSVWAWRIRPSIRTSSRSARFTTAATAPSPGWTGLKITTPPPITSPASHSAARSSTSSPPAP